MHKRIRFVDSLRFFAILLIVVYHCFTGFLPGGFIAVEIFFVISGFFICDKLLRASESKKEHFGELRGFWQFLKNRLTRFCPTLLFCIIIALSLAFFASPDLLTGARPNTLFAATFSTNIANLFRSVTYENSLIPNFFNPTWFLALELQICLVFYLFMSVLYKIVDPKKESGRKRFVSTFAIICFVLGIVSYLLMYVYGDWMGLRDRAYFGPDSHCGAFLLGAALACLMKNKNTQPAKKGRQWLPLMLLLVAGAGITVMSFFISYQNTNFFAASLAGTALLSVAMLIAIKKLQPTKPHIILQKILRPFEYLGKISFAIFLLHYPMYVLLPSIMGGVPLEAVPYIAILISILVAVLLDKVIMPFSKKHKVWFVILLILSLILPIWSLIKAPDTSSIEENLNTEAAQNEEKTEEPAEEVAVDYANLNALTSATSESLEYLAAAKKFARPYPVYTRTYGGAAGSYNTSGRAPWNTPDLSNISALAGARVLVLGDSVVLGATSSIYATVPGAYVDAMGSRNMADAINLLSSYRAANGGNLPYIIVIGLVTNYYAFNAGTLQSILDAAGPGHAFVFMTGYCGDYSRAAQNDTIRAFAASHGNVRVGDWEPIAAANVYSYTYADHIHLAPDGRVAYANLINAVVSGL